MHISLLYKFIHTIALWHCAIEGAMIVTIFRLFSHNRSAVILSPHSPMSTGDHSASPPLSPPTQLLWTSPTCLMPGSIPASSWHTYMQYMHEYNFYIKVAVYMQLCEVVALYPGHPMFFVCATLKNMGWPGYNTRYEATKLCMLLWGVYGSSSSVLYIWMIDWRCVANHPLYTVTVSG